MQTHFRLPLATFCLISVLFALLSFSFINVVDATAPQISDDEFQRISTELSEASGFFPTDNILSNETSLYHVHPLLRETRGEDRAYIGVGPDQNFSYIAQLEPRIAFIIDIRRDNRLHHLFFKEVFRRSANRWEFLSLLFGKPLPPSFRRSSPSGARALVEYFRLVPSSTEFFQQNFEEMLASMQEKWPDLVSDRDRFVIFRIASSFYSENLNLRYRMRRGRTVSDFPTLRDLLEETDLEGLEGHYLATEERFRILKEMQDKNRIIPLVGNFAGPSALREVGEYLKEHGYTVSAFYFSNVEFYLFRQGIFDKFIENLSVLPFDDSSVVIRSFFNFWYGYGRHPDAVPGYYVTQLAQKAESLLENHSRKPYWNYWDLVTRDYLPTYRAIPADRAVP